MIRIVDLDAMQFIQQFPGDLLGLHMFHAVDYPVPNRFDCLESFLGFQPINEGIRRRWQIGGSDALTGAPAPRRVAVTQPGVPQSDAIHLAEKTPLQRCSSLIKRKLDARRAAIDAEDGSHGIDLQTAKPVSNCAGSYSRSSPMRPMRISAAGYFARIPGSAA